MLKSVQETCLKTVIIILFSFGDASGAELKQLHIRSKSIQVFHLLLCMNFKKSMGLFCIFYIIWQVKIMSLIT